jgi:hypothetical protein
MQRAGITLIESMQKQREANKEFQCDIEPVLDGSSLFWRLVGTTPEAVDQRSSPRVSEASDGEVDETKVSAVHVVQLGDLTSTSDSVLQELHEATDLQAAQADDTIVLVDAEALKHIYIRLRPDLRAEDMLAVMKLAHHYLESNNRPTWLPITLMVKGDELPAFSDLLSIAISTAVGSPSTAVV